MSEETNNFECNICFSPYTKEDLFSGLCGGSDCTQMYFCRTCLKEHFERIVNAGFDGVCLKMRCPSCMRRCVPRTTWESFVDPLTTTLFKDRASKLLSIQCANCHQRGSMFLKVDINTSEISVEDHRKQRLDSLLSMLNTLYPAKEQNSNTENEVQQQTENESLQDQKEEEKNDQPDAHSIFLELLELSSRYQYDEISIREMYDLINKRLKLDDSVPAVERLSIFLRTIEDEERRALLHLRHLYLYPRTSTYCCKKMHCFRCKIRDFHEGQTCDQYQAARNVNEEIILCTQCNLSLVKGDGCNSIRCLCGKVMNWEYELGTTRSEAFDSTFGPTAGKKAVEAILFSKDVIKPLALIHAQSFQARKREKYNEGLLEVWKEYFPHFPDESAIYFDEFLHSTEGRKLGVDADKLIILRDAWLNTYTYRIDEKKTHRKRVEQTRLNSLFDGKYDDIHYCISKNPQMQQIFSQYGMFSENPFSETTVENNVNVDLSSTYTKKNSDKFIGLYGRKNDNSIDFETALKWAKLFEMKKFVIPSSHQIYFDAFKTLFLTPTEEQTEDILEKLFCEDSVDNTLLPKSSELMSSIERAEAITSLEFQGGLFD